MTKEDDFWGEDDFENTVASALIACFENKVRKNRGAPPADRMTDERLALLRAEGPYVASNSRIIDGSTQDDGYWRFDVANDHLPQRGCYAFTPKPGQKLASSRPGSYLLAIHLKRTEQLGKYWHKRQGGTLYEMLVMSAEGNGVDGERRFVTVGKDGKVVSCTQRIAQNRGHHPGIATGIIEPDDAYLHETGIWAAVSLQMLADRRFCWTITAQEKAAKAHLGCMQEEIKSLLYARSLPMTATGRKRPILHLVEAHKRRMKSGHDVDVSAFLRGQQTVEIGGTLFKVQPPVVLRPTLSRPSQRRYYDGARA